jgi:hypothetical protein
LREILRTSVALRLKSLLNGPPLLLILRFLEHLPVKIDIEYFGRLLLSQVSSSDARLILLRRVLLLRSLLFQVIRKEIRHEEKLLVSDPFILFLQV